MYSTLVQYYVFFTHTVILINMKNTCLDWHEFWLMYYWEIQGLFKDFCHNPRTFQGFIQIQGLSQRQAVKFKDFPKDKQSNTRTFKDKRSNSRAFQYCTNPAEVRNTNFSKQDCLSRQRSKSFWRHKFGVCMYRNKETKKELYALNFSGTTAQFISRKADC